MSIADQSRILRALDAATARLEDEIRRRTEPIAIVGMGCRLPGGVDDPDAFWQLLVDGVDAIGECPRERVDLDTDVTDEPHRAGITATRYGAFLDDIDAFDAAFFGISPREAATLDPQHRLLLEVAWHTIERAGWTRATLQGSQTGVFVGITSTDYARRIAREIDRVDAHFVTGNALNAAAGRLSYVLGLQGPSFAIDSACSSSLVALHLACQSLRARECDRALAAGVNLILSPEGLISLSKSRVLSSDGRCRTFDAAADGIGRGEGCVVLALRRASEAERDGEPIAALIRGSAVNQDGASSGLTVPNGPAQEAVIRQALAAAGLPPAAIDYVEAHGTGTALGDPIELSSLAQVFAATRPADRQLLVGSVKANIAHSESAAGLAGVLKTVLAMRHRLVPPQIHVRTLTPHVDWATNRLHVPTEPTPWPATGAPAVAGVSSFGISGTNAHVVLQEAPGRAERTANPPSSSPVLLPVTARCDESLRALATRYADRLDARDVSLVEIAHASVVTRDSHIERAAIVASTASDAAAQLRGFAVGDAHDRVRRGTARGSADVVFLFGGQGSQATSMGRRLDDTEPVFRAAVDRCAAIAGRDWLFGADADLADTAAAQPALFVFQYALAALWRSWGIEPSAVMGHSVGEYVAACLAGVFTLEDALPLVVERGRLMSALPRTGRMMAVLASEPRVRDAIEAFAHEVAIAAINAPKNVVISGAIPAVDAVVALLESDGVTCRPLTVSHAFHSPLMAPVLEPFRRALAKVGRHRPSLPLYANVSGDRAGDEVTRVDHWVDHIRQPVRFGDGLRALHRDGHRLFLEVAPHAALTAFGRAGVDDPDTTWVASMQRDGNEVDQLWLAAADLYVRGAGLDWRAMHRVTRDPRTVSLPAYPFQRSRYWFVETPSAAIDRHLFEIEWRPSDSLASSSGDSSPWLLVGAPSGTTAALEGELRRRGAAVSRVDPHPGAVEELFDRLDEAATVPRLVHLIDADNDDWDRAQQRGYLTALQILQLCARAQSAPRAWFVTTCAQAAGGVHVRAIDAPIWGLVRTAAVEHPLIVGGLLDVERDTTVETLLEAIASGDAQAAIRGGIRLAPRLRRLERTRARPFRLGASGSHIVTGGYGALGVATTEWLFACGARRFVLCGRRPPSGAATERLTALRAVGAEIVDIMGDIAVRSTVDALVAAADARGPLKGVIHAAGTVDDALLESQDAESYARVSAKAIGAQHLDAATRDRDLQLFVMFSSLASVIGSPGQANYAAANAALDAIAWARHQAGLVGTTINWGPWAEAGMAARLDRSNREALDARGVASWAPRDAFAAMEATLEGSHTQVVAARIDPNRLRPWLRGVSASMLDTLAPAPPTTSAAAPTAVMDLESAQAYLRDRLAAVLRLPAGRQPASSVSLQEQGLDSMMAMELCNRIASELRLNVTVGRFLAGATLQSAAEALVEQAAIAGAVRHPSTAETEEFVL